mmetsp:Transcript_38736/g.125098  ORF Transcript_38736/g.125098 Transcript_38736/m.125098 type:complete len:205 (-) Transcript_38736:392-1006(-)
MDGEVDRLEEHRVRRVVLVDVLGHLGAGDDALQHLRDAQLECVLLGGREVLQHLEELDLEPRGGDAVVQVVVRVVLVEHEPRQRARRLWCRRLPAGRVDRQDAKDEGGDRGEDADVLLVEEGENPVRPLLRRQRVVRLSEEPQRRQRRLLPDVRLSDVVRQQLEHVVGEGLGELLASDVADGVEREADRVVVPRDQVHPDRVDD